MNYLAHAVFSHNDPDLLTGNMIADHIKGRIALERYPGRVRQGVELHRKIDGRTDIHPATSRGKLLFREAYGLYAGPIMDILYDHYLANDPKFFSGEKDLLTFSERAYAQLDSRSEYFPERFAAYYPNMKEHNWLYNYRGMKGIERSLNGLTRRAKYMPPADEAYRIFVGNYYMLNQCYFELIDDISSFVKIEIGLSK